MASDYVVAAVCPTTTGFKIAFTDPYDSLLDWAHFDHEEICQMMRYLTEQKKGCNDLRIVGDPDDEWPLGIVKIFEGYGNGPRWLEPALVRQVMRQMAEWNKRRKYHQARTLGHLYRLNDRDFILPDPYIIARRWERKVAQEIVSECDWHYK